MTYATSVRREIDLNSYTDEAALLAAVDNLKYTVSNALLKILPYLSIMLTRHRPV